MNRPAPKEDEADSVVFEPDVVEPGKHVLCRTYPMLAPDFCRLTISSSAASVASPLQRGVRHRALHATPDGVTRSRLESRREAGRDERAVSTTNPGGEKPSCARLQEADATRFADSAREDDEGDEEGGPVSRGARRADEEEAAGNVSAPPRQRTKGQTRASRRPRRCEPMLRRPGRELFSPLTAGAQKTAKPARANHNAGTERYHERITCSFGGLTISSSAASVASPLQRVVRPHLGQACERSGS